MRNLKLWQKAGLVAAIVGGLTLGGLTPKYDSKGLESKIPNMGVSMAEAKETNPNGYQIPDLRGTTPYQRGYLKEEPTVLVERYVVDECLIAQMSVNGKVFAYGFNPDTKKLSPNCYTIVDSNGDKIFESKYF